MRTTSVQNGFGVLEYFCIQNPLTGEIDCNRTTGEASLRLAVGGLHPKKAVLVNGLNNTVRGYVVASFTATGDGPAAPSTLRFYRPGELRGYETILTTAATTPEAVGVLWPCGLPPRVPALSVDDPNVTASPETGLADEQVVSVTGFGVGGKVWLSECEYAADTKQLGCGQRPAARTSLVTNNHRAGSVLFTVHSSAPSEPGDVADQQPCSHFCVVAARGGSGAWAVAPIVFAP
jgi:hypothetical protein